MLLIVTLMVETAVILMLDKYILFLFCFALFKLVSTSATLFFVFSSVGVAAHAHRHASPTTGLAQPLWHIARASFSPMLPNTVLTQSQFGMASLVFEPTTLAIG